MNIHDFYNNLLDGNLGADPRIIEQMEYPTTTDDLVFYEVEKYGKPGIHAMAHFNNGITVSIVNWGYGSNQGLWEIYIYTTNENGDRKGFQGFAETLYDACIGWLTLTEINYFLQMAERLPSQG